jgi:hypothetical protein
MYKLLDVVETGADISAIPTDAIERVESYVMALLPPRIRCYCRSNEHQKKSTSGGSATLHWNNY